MDPTELIAIFGILHDGSLSTTQAIEAVDQHVRVALLRLWAQESAPLLTALGVRTVSVAVSSDDTIIVQTDPPEVGRDITSLDR